MKIPLVDLVAQYKSIKEEIDEASNPKDKDAENEKIDPVKLDAELLKDLQAAKKSKAGEEGEGGDKGVDVAVISRHGCWKRKQSRRDSEPGVRFARHDRSNN